MSTVTQTNLPVACSPQVTPVDAPFLSVVIVNYRQWRNTARLVRQLSDSVAVRTAAAEVVVVDNKSPYQAARPRIRRMPGVSLRCLRQNRGFARGVNEGCRLSRGQWYLLLNPDVTVAPGFLDLAAQRIQQIYSADPTVGIVGLRLFDHLGKTQASVGRVPTFFGTLVGLLRRRAARKCRDLVVRAPAKVHWVTGCGLLIRSECFELIHGFDPQYFLYYEDVDLCQRALERGWTVWHDPLLQISHLRPLHSRVVSPRLRLLTRHALLTFARKHWMSWQAILLACLVWVEGVWRGRCAGRSLRALARDMIRGDARRAYRRVWLAAQPQRRSREGIHVEAMHAPRRMPHERRPIPR